MFWFKWYSCISLTAIKNFVGIEVFCTTNLPSSQTLSPSLLILASLQIRYILRCPVASEPDPSETSCPVDFFRFLNVKGSPLIEKMEQKCCACVVGTKKNICFGND